MRITREVFFRGDVLHQERVTIPPKLYNHTRLLLRRGDTGTGNVFVPIRSMQFLGVITRDEVIFVDSQAYAVRDGEGGRMILLAWRFDPALHRDSLIDPVPIEVLHYATSQADTQRRLLGEFLMAIDLMLERQGAGLDGREMNVISLADRR
ncbi:MAG: hypothetical protein H6926_00670 [Chromatiales bacterium]|nr:hypothetical protein [Gammaproteobacteria bacterium]MCP5351692.1 hypothetical protein [Chromatiales bacterium]